MVQGRTIRTHEKGERLLAKLAQGYSVTSACKSEGIGRQSYYDWINSDPTFKAAAEDAIEAGTDTLEDIARRRAGGPVHGSDTLLIFLLKARRPDKYRERADLNLSGDLTQRVELIGISEDDV